MKVFNKGIVADITFTAIFLKRFKNQSDSIHNLKKCGGDLLVDLELLELEKSTDPELVKSIFRVMHTIKGSAGFLGLSKLEKLTHAGENLLSKIRDGGGVVFSGCFFSGIEGANAWEMEPPSASR